MDCDKRYIDKTNYLTSLYNQGDANDYFEGAIIDDTSVIDPTFKFSRNKYWKKCNYLFCQDTLRYYYVTDVRMSHSCAYVTCHVDVLMSFKDALLNCKVLAKRNTSKVNHYLDDDKFKSYAMTSVCNYPFMHGEGTHFFDMDNQQFILAVVGNADSSEDEGGEGE
jgi:hypothetical protein